MAVKDDNKRFKGNAGEFHRRILSLKAIENLDSKFGIDCSILPNECLVSFLTLKIVID